MLFCQLSIFIACDLQFTFDRLDPAHQLMYIQFLLQNMSGEDNQVFVCKYCRHNAAESWNCIIQHITNSVIRILTKLLAGQWGTVVQFPAEVRNFSVHHCFITDWDLPNYIHCVLGAHYLGNKAAGAWNWPLISIWCWGDGQMEHYIHSTICLNGVHRKLAVCVYIISHFETLHLSHGVRHQFDWGKVTAGKVIYICICFNYFNMMLVK